MSNDIYVYRYIYVYIYIDIDIDIYIHKISHYCIEYLNIIILFFFFLQDITTKYLAIAVVYQRYHFCPVFPYSHS